MARISEDVSKVRMYLGPAILYGMNVFSLFVIVIYSMIRVSPELTLYTLAPLPVLSISIYYVSRIIHTKSAIIQRQLAKLNSIAQEVYSGIRVIKAYVQEKFFIGYFTDESLDYRNKSMDLARVNALFFPLMVLLVGVSTLITVYAGLLMLSKGLITTGNIIEFVIYVNMLTWPITSLGWIASLIEQAAASQARINEYLQTEPAIKNNNINPFKLEGVIEFKDVSFIYPDTGIKATDCISFRVEPGQKLAIVGKTASGKTTIMDLILRLYDPTEGKNYG